MNDDPQYSLANLITMWAWAATAVTILASWLVWALVGAHARHVPILMAQTACVLSAIAAVGQIRSYASRVCRLVRVTSGLERPEPARPAVVRQFVPADD